MWSLLPPRSFCGIVALAMLVAAAPRAFGDVRVGIVFDVNSSRNDELRKSLGKEFADLDKGKFGLSCPEDKCVSADGTVAGVHDALGKLLADHSVNMVVTLGPLSSLDACRRGALSKPVIAARVLGGDLLHLPKKDVGSGVSNLVYLASSSPFKRDLESFRELTPFKKVAVLLDKQIATAAPELFDACGRAARELGAESMQIPVDGSAVDAAVGAIPRDVDAAYIVATPRISDADFNKLVGLLIDRRLPSFSAFGRDEVERGLLAALTPGNDGERVIRRAALSIQRILMGESAESLPVDFSRDEALVLNMSTGRAIGFSPKWELRTEAELLNDDSSATRSKMDLADAVKTAVDRNLDLVAASYKVAAGEENIREAKSKLLPKVDASVMGLVIDEDRAACTAGTTPERTLTASLALTQVLYAEPANANIEAQKLLQRAREYERDRAKLDLMLDSSKAYLNVMRAKTGERIRKDALRMTRSHLELAKVRRSVGTASPSEVYRWETEIANSRKAVIEAEALRNAAEIALNRYLHLPQEEKLDVQEIGPNDTRFVGDENPLSAYISNEQTFGVLRDFMVGEGLNLAPELKQYDMAIAAQDRGLTSAKRSHYLPIVAMQADVKHYIVEKGEGADAEFPMSLLLTYPDENDWDVGVKASLPLYAGGSRKAAVLRAEQTLAQLKTEQSSAREKIEQRIRSYVLAARASNEVIGQTRKAADSARQTLELAEDAYAQGLVSIVELIDAQTQRIVTSELANNSVYDFLINLMEAQRASSTFTFFMSDDERSAFYSRLDVFFTKSGVAK
jgi:outer membrane protein TolC/ABC-type uncharacterized transport system substrate-binding protein